MLTRRSRVDSSFGVDGHRQMVEMVPLADVTVLAADGDATLVCGRSSSTLQPYMVRLLPSNFIRVGHYRDCLRNRRLQRPHRLDRTAGGYSPEDAKKSRGAW